MKGTEPMTEDELARIDACVSKATQGPWFDSWLLRGGRGDNTIDAGRVNGIAVARVVAEEDRAFIASAREDVPRLLAEVRRLRAKIESNAEWHREQMRREDEFAGIP